MLLITNIYGRITISPSFQPRSVERGFYRLSAVISDPSKVGDPLVNDLTASGLNDVHDVAQRVGWNTGIVIAQVAPPGLSNPYLCCPGAGRTGAHMDMDGFQRVIFV